MVTGFWRTVWHSKQFKTAASLELLSQLLSQQGQGQTNVSTEKKEQMRQISSTMSVSHNNSVEMVLKIAAKIVLKIVAKEVLEKCLGFTASAKYEAVIIALFIHLNTKYNRRLPEKLIMSYFHI